MKYLIFNDANEMIGKYSGKKLSEEKLAKYEGKYFEVPEEMEDLPEELFEIQLVGEDEILFYKSDEEAALLLEKEKEKVKLKRMELYPSIMDQLEAMYLAREGDDTMLKDIDQEIKKVKDENPIPTEIS